MSPIDVLDYGFTIVRPVHLDKSARTALLIIDMQYHDASPDGSWNVAVEKLWPGSMDYFNKKNEEQVIPTIESLLQYFRQSDLPVVHITVGSEYRDYRDFPSRFREQVRHLEEASGVMDILWSGNDDFAVRKEVAPERDETVICKRTNGAFNSSHVDQVLREMGIRSLVITGVVTSACVATTAIDAADRGYGSVIVEQGVADTDADLHEATLRIFHANHGRVIRGAEDVIEAIETDRPV